MSHGFHILDVFARGLYSGNQLAVVLDAGDLETDTMQAIALETNFSETTFITAGPDNGGAYRVRIFTPTQELPFAGHPTLGTAWLIRHVLHDEPPDRIKLELGIGRVLECELLDVLEGDGFQWILSCWCSGFVEARVA